MAVSRPASPRYRRSPPPGISRRYVWPAVYAVSASFDTRYSSRRAARSPSRDVDGLEVTVAYPAAHGGFERLRALSATSDTVKYRTRLGHDTHPIWYRVVLQVRWRLVCAGVTVRSCMARTSHFA